jgi:hypothetical protein
LLISVIIRLSHISIDGHEKKLIKKKKNILKNYKNPQEL